MRICIQVILHCFYFPKTYTARIWEDFMPTLDYISRFSLDLALK